MAFGATALLSCGALFYLQDVFSLFFKVPFFSQFFLCAFSPLFSYFCSKMVLFHTHQLS